MVNQFLLFLWRWTSLSSQTRSDPILTTEFQIQCCHCSTKGSLPCPGYAGSIYRCGTAKAGNNIITEYLTIWPHSVNQIRTAVAGGRHSSLWAWHHTFFKSQLRLFQPQYLCVARGHKTFCIITCGESPDKMVTISKKISPNTITKIRISNFLY